MNLRDFDFDLPNALIAVRPLSQRDSARLLVVYSDGRLEHRHFSDLPAYLTPPDLIGVNDSRVVPARLTGIRTPRSAEGTPAKIELTLIRRLESGLFVAFGKPARRLR